MGSSRSWLFLTCQTCHRRLKVVLRVLLSTFLCLCLHVKLRITRGRGFGTVVRIISLKSGLCLCSGQWHRVITKVIGRTTVGLVLRLWRICSW